MTEIPFSFIIQNKQTEREQLMSTKRACDACHRRKIRCVGGQPCWNCGHASLCCTYNAVPQKKGPKGNRAKVILELKEKQERHPTTMETLRGYCDSCDTSTPLLSPSYLQTTELIDEQIVHKCIETFFIDLYPTMPILHREILQERVKDMYRSIDTYCLIMSLCAFVIIQPGLRVSKSDSTPYLELTSHEGSAFGKAIFEEVARMRRTSAFIDNPNVDAVVTAFFLFGCCCGLDKHSTAWFYLREATTLAEILGMNQESYYSSMDISLGIRHRRLYWLLFVTERAYALQRHRTLTLHPKLTLPTPCEESNEITTISGFIHLVNLFRPFDDNFVGLWNETRTGCTAQWLAQMQQQLTDALPARVISTESQTADLRVSQQWLRLIIWRLSMIGGFLSSTSPQAAMKFTYPIEIAQDLIRDTSQLCVQSMNIHGIGLTTKVFDVACGLMDVMSCTPPSSPIMTLSIGPKNHLNHLCALLSRLRGGASRFLPILMARLGDMDPSINFPLLTSPSVKSEDYFSFSGDSSTCSDPSPGGPTSAAPTRERKTATQYSTETIRPIMTSEPPVPRAL